MKKIAVIMGSDSDMPLAEKALDRLAALNIPAEARIMSAHRTPEAVREFALAARGDGFAAVIAIAGKAAHLAGAIAALTTLPVIGVPSGAGGLGGLDALLSTVQMPSGIPVATVAVDGAENAAILAVEIIAVTDADTAAALENMRRAMAERVYEKDKALAGK